MDEAKLREKLTRIEALFAGATTEGERVAAGEARRRIRERLESAERVEPPVEFRFALTDTWSRKLFLALLRRYDLKPYRHRGQRRTSVMVKAPKGLVHETLWPEFQQINAVMQTHLGEVAERIIAETLQGDSSEASEVDPPKLGPGPVDIGG
ncbi:MAG TPA: hypothetical protein VK762_20270 [Polyangiaceae bacterium]|jgi:hypothetical protein|nr:hypothetical protein [Polyangiaceae bacterium]